MGSSFHLQYQRLVDSSGLDQRPFWTSFAFEYYPYSCLTVLLLLMLSLLRVMDDIEYAERLSALISCRSVICFLCMLSVVCSRHTLSLLIFCYSFIVSLFQTAIDFAYLDDR